MGHPRERPNGRRRAKPGGPGCGTGERQGVPAGGGGQGGRGTREAGAGQEHGVL